MTAAAAYMKTGVTGKARQCHRELHRLNFYSGGRRSVRRPAGASGHRGRRAGTARYPALEPEAAGLEHVAALAEVRVTQWTRRLLRRAQFPPILLSQLKDRTVTRWLAAAGTRA